jgi:hypothetical protein
MKITDLPDVSSQIFGISEFSGAGWAVGILEAGSLSEAPA